MERLTRLLVVLSTLVALAGETWLVAWAWPPAVWWTVGAAVAAAALARRWPAIASAAVLASAYLVPLVFRWRFGLFIQSYLVLWSAAVMGLVLARRPARPWSLPGAWRSPLIFWALVLATTWPVVAMREADFTLTLFVRERVANTSVGVPPGFAALGILDTVVIQLAGLLFADWLCERFRDAAPRLDRDVLWPLGAGAVAACTFGVYQGFFDLGLLSGGRWPILGRAAGTLVDANAFGAIAAMWGPGLVALVWQRKDWPAWVRATVASAGLLLALTAVWVSGSRTAALAAVVGLVFLAVAVLAAVPRGRRSWVAGAAVALALCLLLVASVLPSTSVGPLRRLYSGMPTQSTAGVRAVARELWNRNGYGGAAVQMIREFPWVGVGAGTFNMLVADYSYLRGTRVPFDNAQNWFRHQLAELGLLGSLGWIGWMAVFARLLWRSRGQGARRVPAAAVKGTLVGLAGASMLGVPSQNSAVSFTFWVFAFWYLALVASDEPGIWTRWSKRPSRVAWAMGLALVAAYAAGTYAVARGELLPANRAKRVGWDYHYGLYDLETGVDGAFRQTRKEAVAVIPVEGTTLTLDAWINHPDAAERPVELRVWIDGTLVVDRSLHNASHLVRDVRMPAGDARVVVRTWVSRTWRPADFGSEDTRELGAALADWTFR